jgi:hypothetical protein
MALFYINGQQCFGTQSGTARIRNFLPDPDPEMMSNPGIDQWKKIMNRN